MAAVAIPDHEWNAFLNRAVREGWAAEAGSTPFVSRWTKGSEWCVRIYADCRVFLGCTEQGQPHTLDRAKALANELAARHGGWE